MSAWQLLIAALAAASALVAPLAVAAPDVYFASVAVEGGPAESHSSPTGTSANLSFSNGLLAGQAFAGGTLGTYTTASSFGVTGDLVGTSRSWSIRSEAAMVGNALITGTGNSVSVPMAMFLDGSLQVLLSANPNGGEVGWYNAYTRIIIDIYVDPVSSPAYRAGHASREVSVGQFLASPPQDGRASEGFLQNAAWSSSFGRDTISSLVLTDALSLPVNDAFDLQINLTSFSQIAVMNPFLGPNLNTIAVAISDFSHTLGFIADTPILAMPAGYNFNAPSIGIVDNLCTGSLCVTSPAPEPSMQLMLFAGLSLIIAVARYRRA